MKPLSLSCNKLRTRVNRAKMNYGRCQTAYDVKQIAILSPLKPQRKLLPDTAEATETNECESPDEDRVRWSEQPRKAQVF